MRRRRAQVTDYAARTHASPHLAVRLPHRRRLGAALDTVRELRPATVVDYGAGDGYLVELIANEDDLDAEIVAFEPVRDFREQMEERLALVAHSPRVVAAADDLGNASADLVLLLGVLEHLTLDDRHAIYRHARRILRPGGALLVDVPVEAGVSLVIKNVGRRIPKGDRPTHTLRETVSSAFGRRTFDPRRFTPGYPAAYFLHHKGFDHRVLAVELEQEFVVERRWYTPFGELPALLGNQEAFFLCRLRQGPHALEPDVIPSDGA